MSKKNLSETIRIITRHCELNKHMAIMKIGRTNSRWCKKMQETPEHVLLDCEVHCKFKHGFNPTNHQGAGFTSSLTHLLFPPVSLLILSWTVFTNSA